MWSGAYGDYTGFDGNGVAKHALWWGSHTLPKPSAGPLRVPNQNHRIVGGRKWKALLEPMINIMNPLCFLQPQPTLVWSVAYGDLTAFDGKGMAKHALWYWGSQTIPNPGADHCGGIISITEL